MNIATIVYTTIEGQYCTHRIDGLKAALMPTTRQAKLRLIYDFKLAIPEPNPSLHSSADGIIDAILVSGGINPASITTVRIE